MTSEAYSVAITVAACTSEITITKGEEDASKGTYSLSVSGDVCLDELEGNKTSTVLTAEPAEHYHLTEVTATAGTVGAIANNECTISNITANTTITAVFEEDAKSYVYWYVYGEKVKSEQVYVGDAITAPTPAATLGGKTFVGWTTAPIDGETDEAPALSTPTTMPAGDASYYAVYAKGDATPASLTKMVEGNTLSDGDKLVIVANATDTALYQETISTSYVNVWKCSTLNATTVSANDKNWVDVTATEGGFYLGDDTNGYINMNSNNLYCNSTKSVWTLSDLEDGTFKLQSGGRNLSYRRDLSSYRYWRMGGASGGNSGATVLDLYKYVPASVSYSAYSTFVVVNCATARIAALSVATDDGKSEYEDGAEFTIRGYVTSTPVQENDKYTFWMADATDGGNVIQAYQASSDVPLPNDIVGGGSDGKKAIEITGRLTKYSGTPRFVQCSCTVLPDGIKTDIVNTEAAVKAVKVLRDGQIFILRDGKTYTIQGQLVK